jgi:hypothetical protein
VQKRIDAPPPRFEGGDRACGNAWFCCKRNEMSASALFSCARVGSAFARLVAIFLLAAGVCFAQAGGNSQSAPEKSGSSAPASNTTDQQSSDKSSSQKNAKKGDPAPTTRLKIQVHDANDKPVGNATVYVRFNTPGGFLHRDKLAELDFKTNDDGSVKVPDIPQGKILIQVIAKGWHTFGNWYDVETGQQTIEIKLKPPPKWY